MTKGKKFNAVEKHFMEKEAIYRRMLNRNEVEIKELQDKLVELDLLNKNLQKENDKLNKENTKLLEYVGLSKEDIRAACKKDIVMTNFVRGLTALRDPF